MKRAGESDLSGAVVTLRHFPTLDVCYSDVDDSVFFHLLAFQVLAGYIIFICGGDILFVLYQLCKSQY